MSEASCKIRFRGDDIAVWGEIDGIPLIMDIPHKVDPRGFVRFRPSDLSMILKILENEGFSLDCPIPSSLLLSEELAPSFQTRDYQHTAVELWLKSDSRGIVVLPTGAGKTYVALQAIASLRQRSLIVVPTLDLADQWTRSLLTLGCPEDKIGLVTGSVKKTEELTVTTYESALIQIRTFRDKFGLLVFDEVHHLRGNFRFIGEGYVAPARLGLTATIDQTLSDELHDIVGPVVFHLKPEELLAEGYIANFELRRVLVDLPPPLRAQYKRYSGIYHSFLKKRNLRGLTGFRRMVMMTGTNAEARAALEAYRQARKLAFDSTAKIETVADILKRHRGDRILLFSESVQFVERVSREFLIPSITSRTPSDERKLILSLFRQGEVPIVAASRVLDEGIDIPEASVGIVVSGSGQPRQFVQRLGRLLRPSAPGKRAILYEVLATGTSEYQTSSRRRAGTGRREKRNKSGSG